VQETDCGLPPNGTALRQVQAPILLLRPALTNILLDFRISNGHNRRCKLPSGISLGFSFSHENTYGVMGALN
jgi:hypothetical protein